MRMTSTQNETTATVPLRYEYIEPYYRNGSFYVNGGYAFGVTVPGGQEAELLLYTRDGEEPVQRIPLPEAERIGTVNTVWVEMPQATAAFPEGAITMYNYCFGNRIVADPCSQSIEEFTRTDGTKELRTSLRRHLQAVTDPLEIPFEDCIFYKTHVKGFTAARPRGVKHPGTFAGIRERIPYLKELGINALILMPVYEFFETEEQRIGATGKDIEAGQTIGSSQKKNYWGYTSGFYFAPKQAYSETEDANCAFAELVDELHKAGIECIPEFYFAPGTSGRTVIDVLCSWRLRFHVDGFHLLGDGGWMGAITSEPILRKTKLLHTGFDTRGLEGGSHSFRNLAEMNRDYLNAVRAFLRGDADVSNDEIAWLQRKNLQNTASISYLTDQDGFTMADMVSYQNKHNEANGENNRDGSTFNLTWNCGEEGPSRTKSVRELRLRQIRNAYLLLLTGQSAPMLYGGDEVLNSQDGNNNAWCQDNELGWITWNRTRAAREMTAFVKEAICFRKAHPILHMKEEFRMSDYKSCGFPDISYHSQAAWMPTAAPLRNGIGVLYCGNYASKADGSADDTMYIAYNMHSKEQAFALPKLKGGKKWYLKADTTHAKSFYADGEEPEAEIERGKYVSVPERTVQILVVR